VAIVDRGAAELNHTIVSLLRCQLHLQLIRNEDSPNAMGALCKTIAAPRISVVDVDPDEKADPIAIPSATQ
jgi:hypothetical protein